MEQLLKQYGLRLDEPASPPLYPTPDKYQEVNRKLIPTGEPLQRRVNDKLVFGSDGKLLGLDNVAEWVAKAGNTYGERLEAACQLYRRRLQEALSELAKQYADELEKDKGWQPSLDPTEIFEHVIDQADKDYMLLLAQHLYDLEAAWNGTGYHALTAEFKILVNYIHYGLQYLLPYHEPPSDFATGRAIQRPDNNLVIFLAGFLSSWSDAARGAYTMVYKLGYSMTDIYILNYKARGPLRLSDVMGRNARFVGAFKQLTELEKMEQAPGADKAELQRVKKALLENHQILKDWAFTAEENLATNLRDDAIELARQLGQIQQARPGKRINLVGSSQGSAVLAGFLLQKSASSTTQEGGNLMDDELDKFVDKYALTISAHSGAFLAQADSIAIQSGVVVDLLKYFSHILTAQMTLDLAIDSDFTQASLTALRDPATRARLSRHRGVEIHAANDDITTSLPLAPLPGTLEARMISGRHAEGNTGFGEGAVNKAVKYIHNIFSPTTEEELDQRPALDLESDKLIYSGYLKKGLPDFDILPPTDLLSKELRRQVVPFLTGRAGVVNYAIQKEVFSDLKEVFDLRQPQVWPEPTFKPFNP